MRNVLKRSPLFWILVPFLGGSIIAINLLNTSSQPYIATSLFAVSFCFLISMLVYSRFLSQNPGSSTEKKYSQRWITGVSIFLFALASGIINIWLHSPDQRPDFFANTLKNQDEILVQITDPPQTKESYESTTSKIIAIGAETQMHKASGNLELYFEKDSGNLLPVYGDQVLIKNKTSPLISPKNPGEFDYQKYMSYKGIYHSAYLKKEDWTLTGKNTANPFWSSIYALNSRLKSEITKALPDPAQKGIAEALLIGNESDIPNDIMTDYAGTGTVHILSVSGLHVGIIIIGLSWIFSFLMKLPFGKYIRLVLILAIIWFYAFLTGFSAPIARSVIMFSIVFIGVNIGRRANIYNSICGSALILLLIDPFMIMQASFQLSFVALTGIVWLQPKIAAWWQPDSKLLNYVWQLAAASLAAQFITLPISILYFNQVSIYFLPANLIVIPASFIVLIVGIAFVFVQMAPLIWLHHFMSWLLYGCIYIMNLIVRFINDLPGATWHGIYINGLGAFLLSLFMMLLISGFIYRNKKLLLAGITFGLAFFGARDFDIYNSFKNNELSIMAISKNHTVITLKDRNKLYVLSDSGFVHDKALLQHHVNGYAWKNYISPENIVCLNSEITSNFSNENLRIQWPFVGFYDQTVLMLNSEIRAGIRAGFTTIPSGDIDAIVLYNNPPIRLSDLYKKVRFNSVIAASGVRVTNARNWETECIENNIPFFNLQKSNYLSIPI